MFKKKSYWFILGGLVLIYLIFSLIAPEPVNWNRTYSKKHKYPYGNYATHQMLKDIYPGKDIITSNEPAYNILDSLDSGYNYILITNYANLNDDDSKMLLKYASEGGNIFISAEYFNGIIADTFGISTSVRFNYDILKQETDSVTINFSNPQIKNQKEFQFKKYEIQFYFDESYIKNDYFILGEASDSTVNFIRIPFHKGNFYLHSNPLIFTNYNLLHPHNNHIYISKALSHLPVTHTVWDEYYNMGRGEIQSEMRYILSQPNLKWAWYIILAFSFIYLLFQSKRRQRVIPVIKPLKNTTLEFVKIIGSLYFQQKDHSNLARKKITYFLENIRKNYYLQTHELDDDFIHLLHIKSGVDKITINQLIHMIKTIQKSNNISEKQLLELNKLIEAFNLKSKN